MNYLFYAPQMAPYGGMERHICTLAAAAAERGHRIRLLTTSNSLGDELRGLLAHPEIDFRELPVARMGAGALQKALWLARQTLAARSIGWDAIYTNGQSGLASWVWRAARRGTHVIHHHHTAADPGEQSSWSPTFRKVLGKAPTLAGCSEATCSYITAAVPRKTPPRFLPYLTRCLMRTEEVRERSPSPALKFGFLGRLVKEKGLDAICQLSQDALLSDISWNIHGEGQAYPPELFKSYPNITYHGAYRSAAAHRSILAGLDAVVLLSTHNEGMPLSLIEAMSAGCPWIATDRGGTRELARSSEECLVLAPGEEISTTARRIRAFADGIMEGRVSRLRQKACYEEFLSPERVGAAWLALLAERPERR